MNAFQSKQFICGEFKHPRQMLADQSYGDHGSIHDDKMAEDLGFSGAPIEGPTQFSQFVQLLHNIFGNEWFKTGCISAHYQNMVVDGDEVRAFAELPKAGELMIRIWSEKKDGTPVLTGTASIGANKSDTELDNRIKNLRSSDSFVILADLKVGMKGSSSESVIMDFDQHLGNLYPFSLNEKLGKITESSPWYTKRAEIDSPWGQAIIPLEMISVLSVYTFAQAKFPIKQPAVGLFADQEIKMIKGPLFVNHPYRLEREIVALSESRRVESNWIMTKIFDQKTNELVAECLLNSSMIKSSYKKYDEDFKRLYG
jgi:hypothetical protein